MKYLACALALALALMACGGDIEDSDPEIGTLEQPIYMPLNYGMEGDTTRCSPPWAGGECQVPDSKTISYKISNCGNSTDFNTIKNAIAWAGVIGGQTGFTITHNQMAANWNINCEGGGGAPGSTVADVSTMDCHDTSNGDLCQFQGGIIKVRRGVLITQCASFGCSAAQYDRILQNVVRHEIGHTLGLGHVPYSPTKLMSVSFGSPPDPNPTNPWNNLLGLQADEKKMLQCYRETSGTTPGALCPP